jgi:hypothetical protein
MSSLAAVLCLLSTPFVIGVLSVCPSPSATESEIRGVASSIDPRPDPSIFPSDMYVLRTGTNISYGVFGNLVTVHAIVYNLGIENATNFSVMLGMRSTNTSYQSNTTIIERICDISSDVGNNSLDVNYTWYLNTLVSDVYEIWVLVDPMYSIDERNETNNWATIPFTVAPLEIDITITTDKAEYRAGNELIYFANISYKGTLTPVPYAPGFEFTLVDVATGETVPDTKTSPQTASSRGSIIGIMYLPLSLSKGHYSIVAEFMGEEYASHSPLSIDVEAKPGPLDTLPLAVASIAVIVGVAAVTVYFVKHKPKT